MIRLKQNTVNAVNIVIAKESIQFLLRVYNGTTDKIIVVTDYSDYPIRCKKFYLTIGDIDDLENAAVILGVGSYVYEVYEYSAIFELGEILTSGLLVVGEEVEQEILTETKEQFINSVYE